MAHIARDEDGKFSAYAWPGGYPVYHVAIDAHRELFEVCPDCANAGDIGDARIIESEVNWDDAHLHCEVCGERIESAYAEDEE